MLRAVNGFWLVHLGLHTQSMVFGQLGKVAAKSQRLAHARAYTPCGCTYIRTYAHIHACTFNIDTVFLTLLNTLMRNRLQNTINVE